MFLGTETLEDHSELPKKANKCSIWAVAKLFIYIWRVDMSTPSLHRESTDSLIYKASKPGNKTCMNVTCQIALAYIRRIGAVIAVRCTTGERKADREEEILILCCVCSMSLICKASKPGNKM